MGKLFGGLVAVILGFAAASPAGASWVPGTPWATCSAPLDCGATLYVRRIHAVHAVSVSHRHVRTVRRHPSPTLVRRPLRHTTAHRRAVRTDVTIRGSFQYITDPREAAVTAWADIVNAERYRR